MTRTYPPFTRKEIIVLSIIGTLILTVTLDLIGIIELPITALATLALTLPYITLTGIGYLLLSPQTKPKYRRPRKPKYRRPRKP